MAMPSIVRARPALAYFALTFAISWGGVLLLIGGWPQATSIKAQEHPLFALTVLATLAGPSVAGLALTGALEASRRARPRRTAAAAGLRSALVRRPARRAPRFIGGDARARDGRPGRQCFCRYSSLARMAASTTLQACSGVRPERRSFR